MPHIVIDHSRNIEAHVDLAHVVEAARLAAIETGIFPLGGIRVRTHRAEHVAIADGDPRHGYVDVILRVGKGRDVETRRRAGTIIFQALSKALDPAFARMTIALSCEIVEIDAELNWKRNTVHDAVKAAV